jgi:CDP-6-deoxy-D-xylo-4-hexulose-3-dehydrase
MIRLAEKIIDRDDINRLKEWLDTSDRYTKGLQTEMFEREWSEWVGCKHSVFVNSGSSANLLIVMSLLYSGRLKNNKVIVPAVSWATTVAPVIQLGMEPLLCDADEEDLGLCVADFERLCREHNPSARCNRACV